MGIIKAVFDVLWPVNQAVETDQRYERRMRGSERIFDELQRSIPKSFGGKG